MSLANATEKAKKGGLFFLLVFTLCLCGSLATMNKGEPAPDSVTVKADNAFGELPVVKPESLEIDYTDALFELNTVSGQLPDDIPSVVFVYKFIEPVQSLNSKATAIELASDLGFYKNPVAKSDILYKWTSLLGTKVLEYNLLTKEIKITTDLTKDPTVKQNHNISPDLEMYKESFTQYVNRLPGISIPEEYMGSSYSVEFKNLENNRFVPAIYNASSKADFVDIRLYRGIYAIYFEPPKKASQETLEKYASLNYYSSIVGKDPFYSYISGIVGGTDVENETTYKLYVNIKYIDFENKGKYNVLPIESAYEKLVAGEGFLVYLSNNNSTNSKKIKKFSINYANLAYYEPDEFVPYLQPVYRFGGKVTYTDESRGDFAFYIPAITQ